MKHDNLVPLFSGSTGNTEFHNPVDQALTGAINHQPRRVLLAPDEDTELLKQIAGGSTAALTRFYERYQGNVMAFALRHLSQEEDCLEIVNDVFLTVWSSAGNFAGRSAVRTWLLGICHHKTMDYLRKRQRLNRISEEYRQEQDGTAIEDNVMQAILAQDHAGHIQACLEQLSPVHREALHLAFYEDLSCSEIAQVQSCPLGTVKTRLMHAKARLKALLDAQA